MENNDNNRRENEQYIIHHTRWWEGGRFKKGLSSDLKKSRVCDSQRASHSMSYWVFHCCQKTLSAAPHTEREIEREREREQDRDRVRERERERERAGQRERERKREREREQDRERERGSERDREQDWERERGRERDRESRTERSSSSAWRQAARDSVFLGGSCSVHVTWSRAGLTEASQPHRGEGREGHTLNHREGRGGEGHKLSFRLLGGWVCVVNGGAGGLV